MNKNKYLPRHKSVKGPLLKYYRILYSASELSKDSLFVKEFKYDPVKFVRIVIAYFFTEIFLFPVTKLIFLKMHLQANFLNKLMLLVVIVVPMFFVWRLLAKYFFANERLIKKISHYEEVVVHDKKEMKLIFIKFSQFYYTKLSILGAFILMIYIKL